MKNNDVINDFMSETKHGSEEYAREHMPPMRKRYIDRLHGCKCNAYTSINKKKLCPDITHNQMRKGL